MDSFTFFYKGRFSQWDMSDFVVDGIKYCCAEQYMMAEKARLFNDKATEFAIMASTSPREQKQLGRGVKGFDEDKWNAVARDIVYKGNYAKFTQNQEHLDELMATEGTLLVEASPTDEIWGIGLSAGDLRVENQKYWRGTNWLGEVLTKVRDDIIKGIQKTEDFDWSKQKKLKEFPVKITNKLPRDLWGWDYETIRRQSSELAHCFDEIETIEIIVRPENDGVEVSVLVMLINKQSFATKTLSPDGTVLAAFREALHEIRAIIGNKRAKKTG